MGSLLLNVLPDVESLFGVVHSPTAGVVQQLDPLGRDEPPSPLAVEVALQAGHQPDAALTQHLHQRQVFLCKAAKGGSSCSLSVQTKGQVLLQEASRRWTPYKSFAES